MKKIFILTYLLCSVLFVSAQFTVINTSSKNLKIGIEFSDIGSNICKPYYSEVEEISPGQKIIFPVPEGMEVLRVGATDGIHTGWQNNPCNLSCINKKPEFYTFYWTLCPAKEIKIGL